MANDPLDLWPEGIQVNPLTPLRILKLQADRLRERTRGLLTAEVISTEVTVGPNEDTGRVSEVVHRFEIIAPRLGNYRHQLFVCRHNADLVYPVWIEPPDSHDLQPGESEAPTQDEFVQVVRKVLSSIHSRSLISSLLARIAEADTMATPA